MTREDKGRRDKVRHTIPVSPLEDIVGAELEALKSKYDPNNIFDMWHCILPKQSLYARYYLAISLLLVVDEE